eukprot:2553089-Prymnesium_polylepis.1
MPDSAEWTSSVGGASTTGMSILQPLPPEARVGVWLGCVVWRGGVAWRGLAWAWRGVGVAWRSMAWRGVAWAWRG